jgi:GTP cyclohydrolase II
MRGTPDALATPFIETIHSMKQEPPWKLDALRELGVELRERVPLVIEPHAKNRAYLSAKRTRMRHWLP